MESKEKDWIRFQVASDLTGISIDNIYVQNSTNSIVPKSEFLKINAIVYINKNWLSKNLMKRQHYWLLSHTLYFQLLGYFENEYTIAKWLHKVEPDGPSVSSWMSFFNSSLFARVDDVYFAKIMTKNRYIFIRIARWILAIQRRTNGKFHMLEVPSHKSRKTRVLSYL